MYFILWLVSPSDDAASPHQQAAAAAPYGVSPTPGYPDAGGGPSSSGISQQGGLDVGADGKLSSTLTFARSASVLGYCLLPLVVTSLFGIIMPMDTPLGIVITSAAIMWCTYSASGIFCAVGRMRGMRGLVAYPLALFYVGFGIMGVFSSRGSGTMAKAMSEMKAAAAGGGRGA